MASQIFNHDELEAEIQRCKDEDIYKESLTLKKSKHSLDSDEEDDDEKTGKYNVLDPNELEGQEDRTIDFDGEIKITPFNMKEELEEGYFDKEGTYIFNKEEDVIKDQWLDDIDWVKVKNIETSKRNLNDSDSDDELPEVNLFSHYSKMLTLMKPKETVQKAICRLGGSKSGSGSASSRWKKKKENGANAENSEETENKEKLALLTSLANDIIQSGDMDIYQQTYEKMQFHVNKTSSSTLNISEKNDEAALDMFGDDFEETVDESKPSQSGQDSSPPHSSVVDPDAEVQWEFKWENTNDAKIYGPYPTSQMFQWVTEKYFEDGVFVRQVGKTDPSFNSSKRIDFELYL
ncbi:CD2 antigen cytoplasmic tail-binding protein 2-like [Uloborus diversus]|uniref:CD2 antigen cytoplasmic tail-binding protein 2-like n=1 Tax=Uloborus diversus TaxID=327109 RepID=UPI00240988A2|nr:CD2 antigen cytoplasmic tail-binding protein 2-like [Uloborus diversus]